MNNDSNHDKIYDMMLNFQKQLGDLSTETRGQSEILKAIKAQVEKTNGRVSLLEQFRDTLKGKIAVVVIVGGFVFNVFWAWVKKEINL